MHCRHCGARQQAINDRMDPINPTGNHHADNLHPTPSMQKYLPSSTCLSFPAILSAAANRSRTFIPSHHLLPSRAMSTHSPATTTPTLPDAEAMLDFWFNGPTTLRGWFTRSDAFDAECASRFGPLVASARASRLDAWTAHPRSCLALLLCLDQLPRNLFRDTEEAFASDARAREVAVGAIARGFDREVPLVWQGFFYLPLEHGEDMVAQVASVSLFEGLVGRADEVARRDAEALSEAEIGYLRYGVPAALEHRGIVARFGRFPGRNAAMGRESTAEEVAWLKDFKGFS